GPRGRDGARTHKAAPCRTRVRKRVPQLRRRSAAPCNPINAQLLARYANESKHLAGWLYGRSKYPTKYLLLRLFRAAVLPTHPTDAGGSTAKAPPNDKRRQYRCSHDRVVGPNLSSVVDPTEFRDRLFPGDALHINVVVLNQILLGSDTVIAGDRHAP